MDKKQKISRILEVLQMPAFTENIDEMDLDNLIAKIDLIGDELIMADLEKQKKNIQDKIDEIKAKEPK
jgi:hypothetical protein